MQPSKINGKMNILFGSSKQAPLNTSVNEKVQEEYRKKCMELKLKFKPLANTPEIYHNYEKKG